MTPRRTTDQAAETRDLLVRAGRELFGSIGNGGMLVYTDVDGHPHKVDVTDLPWSHTETTTLTVVSGSISAQVRGGQVGCRIRVDGVVRNEQSNTDQDAHVFCIVKSARASIG